MHGAGDLREEEVPAPQAGPGRVRLRVAYAGICGSDLHYFAHGANGEFVVREPLVPGHEVSGTVDEDPSGELAPGTPVTVHPATFGPAADGLERHPHLRPGGSYLGSASTWPHTQGGMSERLVVRRDMVRVLPPEVPLRRGALAEPLAVALHAVRVAGSVQGARVLVSGAGPIGQLTAAAALASGDVTTESRIPSPRVLDLPETTAQLRNFGGGSCSGETSTLADALRISCNTAFGQLGLDLGDDALREQAEAFGFGDDSLSVPTSVATSVFPEDPDEPQTAQSAIGQFNVRATPLQMAMVAAGVANDGEVMEPYLVREVQAPDLSRLDQADPKVLNRAVDEDVAEQLTEMMELVVSDGSGVRAQIDGVRVAGKTGTAQHAEGRPPHAWFIGFAPADDPQVAVAVVVEDGGSLGSEATGGALSAPVARRVMSAVLRR